MGARPRVLALVSVTAAGLAAFATPASAVTSPTATGAARPAMASRMTRHSPHLTVVYQRLPLANGDTATVYSNGLAEIWNRTRTQTEYRTILPTGAGPAGTAAALPSRSQLSFDLLKAPAQPYIQGELEIVLGGGLHATRQNRLVPPQDLAGTVPDFTTDPGFNRVLASLGTESMTAVFPAARVRGLRTEPGGLSLAQAYVLRVTRATMPAAIAALTRSGAVRYASPDWTVSAFSTSPIPVPAATRRKASALARRLAAHPPQRPSTGLPALPSNFALQSSEQSLLNRPGVDWVPAYEALEARFHQLPGAGETITDVSLGDLDSAGTPVHDACHGFVKAFGPTTVVRNGQRFLDWPSMPFIPTWTASPSASLDPTGEVCGVDPSDTEVGLDFSVMAPLPHSEQRASEPGSGLTDLLGIAPGARYRLVVPAGTAASITGIDEAFLAAAQQTPRPNVITASLGFGEDSFGFPSRYLEDDPLTEALVASIVNQMGINVAISANDGLRNSTNAAVSPAGGSAPTDVAQPGGTPTNLNSIFLSTAPSQDFDSGAIDVGGTTLDDISAAEPQDPANTSLVAQHAFPETRFDGYGTLSSGFGTRVDVSAPADNLTAFEHTSGGAADNVTVVNIGGTSGSVQEAGAAAAVLQQTARLAGDSSLASSPLALRAELEKTATPVPNPGQADTTLSVGPQVDLGKAVTSLLAASPGAKLTAGVARVAVEQRQPDPGRFNQVFFTPTDPGAISLAGTNTNAWVTISPDWVGLPAGATFRLSAVRESGGRQLLATGAWARLQPDAILAAAGLSPSSQAQAVSLSYTARAGGKVVASAAIPLAFSGVSGVPEALAPVVPPVVTGATIPVTYDLTGQPAFSAPRLVVSEPGRMNPQDDFFFRPVFTVSLPNTSGTVQVPVSALQGGGIYGIGIQASPDIFFFSDFAYTRVQASASAAAPPAPELSAAGSPATNMLTIPDGGNFSVGWNVGSVPGATGAFVEISAPGPNDFNSFATFNNPGGTIRDKNGFDSGSIFFQRVKGVSGQITISGTAADLDPSMFSSVRIVPVTSAGVAAGEASPVSTITMNGIAPADGGSPVEGFGVGATQPTGFVTSNQTDAQGQSVSSVEAFSEQTQAITHTVTSSTGDLVYTTLSEGGAGLFAGDTGLVTASNSATSQNDTFQPTSHTLAPWKPPTTNTTFVPADNQQSPSAVFGTWDLSGTHGFFHVGVFTSDVAARTFTPVIRAEQEVSKFRFPTVTGVAQDTTTGTAVLAASDFLGAPAPPTYITVNLANQAVSTFSGVGTGTPEGVAVDSGTGVMVGPQDGGVGIYNLASGAGVMESPGGAIYEHPAVDPARKEFVVQEFSSPDENLSEPGLGATPNDNALSSEVVLNEQGQLVQRIERFNFFNTFSLIAGDLNQLETSPGLGYTMGLDGGELAPFPYGQPQAARP